MASAKTTTTTPVNSAKKQASGGFFDVEVLKTFLFGGTAGCLATSLTQPVDTIKVQIQVIGEANSLNKGKNLTSINPFIVMRNIMRNEGIRGFYKGLDAAILRQITYGTTRLGMYRVLSDKYKEKHHANPQYSMKALFSIIAGVSGCLVGNPADLALVRCQRDSLLPPDQRRNYKNVNDAISRIYKEEGFFALWKGCVPTIFRAISMNIGMLSTYNEIKERVNKAHNTKEDTLSTQAIASAIAGIVCSLMSLPFDNAKTKLMGMKIGPDGKAPYKNIFDCIQKSAKQAGVTGLWVGLPTYICRVSPHASAALLIQDFLHETFSPKHIVD